MDRERIANYLSLKAERDLLRLQLEEIEAGLFHPAAQRLSKMPSAPSKERAMERKVNKHMAIAEHYKRLLKKTGEELAAIEKAIETLPPKERLCIRCRYIMGYSAEKTSEIMGVERRQLNNIKNSALDRLERQERERTLKDG